MTYRASADLDSVPAATRFQEFIVRLSIKSSSSSGSGAGYPAGGSSLSSSSSSGSCRMRGGIILTEIVIELINPADQAPTPAPSPRSH